MAAQAAIEDVTRRRQIARSNLEDPALALIRQISTAFDSFKVNELNLVDQWLNAKCIGPRPELRAWKFNRCEWGEGAASGAKAPVPRPGSE
jgi:hypothetical protein